MSDPRPILGFLGLGNLGLAMATRLVDTGFDVVAFDLSDTRLGSFRDAGGRAGSLADVFECETVCVVTPDEQPIASFFRDVHGTPGVRTILLHSTVLPQRAIELAGELSERGIDLIEAPVSGGPDRARSGELALLLSGTASALEQAKPVLAALGTERFVLGDIGAASATKLANQLVMFSAVEATHEALALTNHFGVDHSSALEAIAAGTGDTWVGRNWGFFDAIVADYDAGDTPPEQRPWRKDLREFTEAADAAGLDAPLAQRILGTVGDRIERVARNNNEGAQS